MMELVTIIKKGKSLTTLPAEGRQLSGEQAKTIVMREFYPDNKHLWKFKTMNHGGGVVVCAFGPYFQNAIGVWWAKGNKVYNVNGIARSKTNKLEVTFDPNINLSEVVKKCEAYR
jgi:hypothetical protein